MNRTRLLAVAIGLVFALLLATAIFLTPGYRPVYQWLSDLGVGPAALFFNLACIASGFLLMPFYFFLSRPTPAGRLGALAGVAAAVNLVGVGVFTEYTPLHSTVSIAFFTLATLSALLLSTSSKAPARMASLLLLAASLALALTSFIPLEWFCVALYGLWLYLESDASA